MPNDTNTRCVCLLTALIVFMVFASNTALGYKKHKKSYKRYYRKPAVKRSFYRYRKSPVKLYQEIYLSPKVSKDDISQIESILKENGAASARIDAARNSLIVQYSSKILSAVDIMQLLKKIGYTVSSID